AGPHLPAARGAEHRPLAYRRLHARDARVAGSISLRAGEGRAISLTRAPLRGSAPGRRMQHPDYFLTFRFFAKTSGSDRIPTRRQALAANPDAETPAARMQHEKGHPQVAVHPMYRPRSAGRVNPAARRGAVYPNARHFSGMIWPCE